MKESRNPLNPLIEHLSKLPGIGPKSAQRIAFHFLAQPLSESESLTTELLKTRSQIKYCRKCYNISFEEQCWICRDGTRDQQQICVVAEPRDVFAIDRTNTYKGCFHVLGGLISPLDGVHPESLRVRELIDRIKGAQVTELIFAINPNIEGEATILYLTNLLKPLNLTLTKLAYGLPMGSDIDYADELTLEKSLLGRTEIQ